jgi:hypothetical protein
MMRSEPRVAESVFNAQRRCRCCPARINDGLRNFEVDQQLQSGGELIAGSGNAGKDNA